MHRISFVLATALLALLPGVARADTLLAPAGGAQVANLTAGGGYMAWSTRDGGVWRLTVRDPDGRVTTPDVPSFRSAPRASIGSGPIGDQPRPLLLVYGRDDGDIWSYDLRAGTERKVTSISTRGARETLPTVKYGSYVFARSGGRSTGIWYAGIRADRPRRVLALSSVPRALASNGTRYAYVTNARVTIRRLSGEGRALFFRLTATPRDLYLTRYRAGWLLPGGGVFETSRFGGSGDTSGRPTADDGRRSFPEDTQSIALERDRLSLYLDREGVHRADPRPFS